MSDEIHLRLTTPDWAHLAVCDQLCADLWRVATGDTVHVDETPVRITATCAHCVRCGELVAAPAVCRVHEDGCPEFDPLVTVVVATAVRKLTVATGRPLSARAWKYLESSAWTVRANGMFNAEALIRRMMGLRVDWETE